MPRAHRAQPNTDTQKTGKTMHIGVWAGTCAKRLLWTTLMGGQ